MSVHPHHTTAPAPAQPLAPLLLDSRWEHEILPLLPPDLEARARAHHAWVRRRELTCAADLLRGLLAYVLCCSSFAHLGAWATLLTLASLSPTAWRNRLTAASSWLDNLLQALIATPVPVSLPGERVVIFDSSIVRHPDHQGEDWRVHLAYDLSAGHAHTVRLTDDHTGEHTSFATLGPGDIGLMDAGFARRKLLGNFHQTGAAFCCRLDPRVCPLETATGERVDLVAWLQSCNQRYHRRDLVVRNGHQTVAVRLIAVRLSAAAAAKARRRKRRKASMDQRQITEATLFLAGWMLLITTLAAREWPTDAVVRLYRARWQIELVFKRMKSVCRLAELRCFNRVRAEAVLRARLVAWALAEKISGTLQVMLPAGTGGRRRPASSWGVVGWAVASLRQIVAGGWSLAQLQACMARLGRYLCSSPRRRSHQETRIRRWLAARAASVTARHAQEAASLAAS